MKTKVLIVLAIAITALASLSIFAAYSMVNNAVSPMKIEPVKSNLAQYTPMATGPPTALTALIGISVISAFKITTHLAKRTHVAVARVNHFTTEFGFSRSASYRFLR